MTSPAASDAALHVILRRAANLILEFNGPVCHLEARQTEQVAADRLRAILAQHDAEIPDTIATTTDPLTVLAYAATISPELAAQAEAELTRVETEAAIAARPTGYSHDLITSARESRRTVTIISTWSADAVRSYLDRASLDEQISHVIGRAGHSSQSATGQNLISRALNALSTDPATCVLIAESTDILDSATASGVATIAYARTPDARNLGSAHIRPGAAPLKVGHSGLGWFMRLRAAGSGCRGRVVSAV
jgi:beta-phosphoglucomutase-like phosphatase (HAD superfamily)